MREFIFCLFIVEIIAVLYLIVHDQALMPDIQGSAFALYRRPDTTRVAKFRVDEVCAMGAHAIAIFLGSILVHNSDYAPNMFMKFGYAIRMRELDESTADVPDGSMITFAAIRNYASQLKETWHAAYSIIDLVDVTDFYLLLFEEDLFAIMNGIGTENFRANQRALSVFGLCDWEVVRVIWVIAFVTSSFGRVWDALLLGFFSRLNLGHLARWSNIPSGMRFWQLYVIKRESEKEKKLEDGKSTTGPYPASWQAAKKYYEFNLPRKKNQQAFSAAARSLFFVEAPFLYWRVLCSEKYGIVASSLLIKNVLSLIYDLYIFGWGLWRLYLMIWRRTCCQSCSDSTVDRLEEQDREKKREREGQVLVRQRSTRIMGAKSWLTTEQLMAQPDHKAAYNEYRKTGVVPTYFYSEDVYGENIHEMAEDEVVVFLESTGMVA